MDHGRLTGTSPAVLSGGKGLQLFDFTSSGGLTALHHTPFASQTPANLSVQAVRLSSVAASSAKSGHRNFIAKIKGTQLCNYPKRCTNSGKGASKL